MSEAPEIAPEIRGLLEEIVADPRSSIRLVPRRALRSWFERGEPVRPREVATTRAERHLIEAHREALANLLTEASRIACCKAPKLAHLPTTSDGAPYDFAGAESRWTQRAESVASRSPKRAEDADLLRQCLQEKGPGNAHSLALAALGLVPSDSNRMLVAFTTPWDQPRTSIALLERVSARAQDSHVRYQACINGGQRWCVIEQLITARDRYREANSFGLTLRGMFYSFHLSCCLRDRASVLADAAELANVVPDARDVVEAAGILRQWCTTRPIAELRVTSSFVAQLSSHLPAAALALFEGYPS